MFNINDFIVNFAMCDVPLFIYSDKAFKILSALIYGCNDALRETLYAPTGKLVFSFECDDRMHTVCVDGLLFINTNKILPAKAPNGMIVLRPGDDRSVDLSFSEEPTWFSKYSVMFLTDGLHKLAGDIGKQMKDNGVPVEELKTHPFVVNSEIGDCEMTLSDILMLRRVIMQKYSKTAITKDVEKANEMIGVPNSDLILVSALELIRSKWKEFAFSYLKYKKFDLIGMCINDIFEKKAKELFNGFEYDSDLLKKEIQRETKVVFALCK
jgi:hypothetical protein